MIGKKGKTLEGVRLMVRDSMVMALSLSLSRLERITAFLNFEKNKLTDSFLLNKNLTGNQHTKSQLML